MEWLVLSMKVMGGGNFQLPLTLRLNQDCLENVFSWIRAITGNYSSIHRGSPQKTKNNFN
uniref:Uncharacterized protein n=1 Tax=Lepeophtheirus salmonis TaxID=72036 RepID=A0A0K2SZN0_LEPSM